MATDPPPGSSDPTTCVGIEGLGAVEAIVPAWRALAGACGTPFGGPDWLLPWWRAYGTGSPRLVTWWDGDRLVGLAPVTFRARRLRGLPVREGAFWGATGTPLEGWVGPIAADGRAARVGDDLAAWLRRDAPAWDVFHCLRLPAGGIGRAWMARTGATGLSLSGVLQSEEYVVDLVAPGPGPWPGYLGPKARHELRRAARRFAERAGGEYAVVAAPTDVPELVDALRRLLAERWRPREAYFGRDGRFGGFLDDVMRTSFAAGTGFAVVARRDDRSIVGCLFVLAAGREAAAVMIGLSTDPALAGYSIGKALFHRAMDELVARDVAVLDFLTVGGYKERFWHARPRRLESGILGRGPVGHAVLGYVAVRRRALGSLRRRRRAAAGS